MISNLSSKQLRRAASIKDQIETLETELDQLLGASESRRTSEGRRKMSAAAKARIAAAQRARWAKVKGNKAASSPKAGRRKMSTSARAKIAAAARARWARAKAAGKNQL